MERYRRHALRASVPPSTSEGLEAARIGSAILGLAALQVIQLPLVAPVDTYATRLLAQALRSSRRLSWARCAGPYGTCRSSWSRPGSPHLAVAASLAPAMFTITTITFSIVITWVFDNTRAGLLLVILAHTSIDAFSGTLSAIFPARAVADALPLSTSKLVAVVLIVLMWGGRLSYEQLVEAQSPPPLR